MVPHQDREKLTRVGSKLIIWEFAEHCNLPWMAAWIILASVLHGWSLLHNPKLLASMP